MMRTVLVLAALVLAAGSCATPTGPASPRASVADFEASPALTPTEPPTGPSTAVPTEPAATDQRPTEPPPTAAPSTDQTSDRPDPTTFLQVCRQPEATNPDAIPCADAVEAALAAPEL